jgi:hypothetical protein
MQTGRFDSGFQGFLRSLANILLILLVSAQPPEKYSLQGQTSDMKLPPGSAGYADSIPLPRVHRGQNAGLVPDYRSYVPVDCFQRSNGQTR